MENKILSEAKLELKKEIEWEDHKENIRLGPR